MGPATFLVPQWQGHYLATKEIGVNSMLIMAIVEIPLLPLKVQILAWHAKIRMLILGKLEGPQISQVQLEVNKEPCKTGQQIVQME